ncbi:hypothetical protein F8568_038725 [Actinomadura sp. LD22]|uniref:Uncharacterized protein n=1 Tax=Actinomadura physcomitrii TaxID=2650748 RepID=A0A6I4MQ35_9ACTN|nr:hypothetical protein [Actinomadura physcomitrii]MWA06184.1 hypothetical protein [Actinomadura physcomitrii]
MATSDPRRLLGIYLSDHLAGAAGGVALARRIARTHSGSGDAERLARLAQDIAADRGAALSIVRSLGLPVRGYKSVAVWAAEKAARRKFNGRLRDRSPLSDLVELEALRLAVEGKAAGWRTLLAIADRETDLDARALRMLLDRAEAQAAVLEELRVKAVDEVFGGRDVHAVTDASE